MLPVLSVLSFVCLAAAEPHYNYNPPQGGSVALHGFPVSVGAPPLPPFLAIRHDAQSPIRPSVPFHTGLVPIVQPFPPHFAIRDVQVPIKQGVAANPQLVIPSPFFSSVFVPHPPFFAIRDVQVPRVPVSEEEIEEDDDEEEAEDTPQIIPVLTGTLPPFIAAQHDAQTPFKVDSGFLQNIFGFHTDIAYGPPLVDFGNKRTPAVTITNDTPVPPKAPVAPAFAAQHDAKTPVKADSGLLQNIFGFHTDIAYGPPLVDFGNIRTPAVTITNDLPVPPKAPAAPFFTAIRNQQVPIRGTLVAAASDGEDLDDVELVGTIDRTSSTLESVLQGPQLVEIARFPMQIANLFDTREVNPENEIHAPAGIVQSTQPKFVLVPFINSKAHEDIRKAHEDIRKAFEDIPFRNSKAHPDTHKGPNEESAATLFH